MKTLNKWIILSIIITLISLIGTALVYPSLPATIPTHFNGSGVIDGYSGKGTIFFTGAIPLVMLGLFLIVPKVDPKKESYSKHGKAYSIFIFAISLFLIATEWVTILIALGYNISINKLMPVGLGVLFILMGNYLPQVRPNYTFGIKLPWTLNSENNWRATHRIGGYCFVVSGIISILSAFLSGSLPFIISMGALLISTTIAGVYSYLHYRKHDIK